MVKGYESASEGIRALLHQDRKLQDIIKTVESQILSIESQYLEDTQHGNVARGWDGYIDSKPGKKDLPIRKVRPAGDSERLFTNSAASWKQLFSGGSAAPGEGEMGDNETRSSRRSKPKPKKRKREKHDSIDETYHGSTPGSFSGIEES